MRKHDPRRAGLLLPAGTDLHSSKPGSARALRRFLPLGVLAAVVCAVYASGLHRDIAPDTFVRNLASIVAFVERHFATAVAVYVAFYIAVVAASVPAGSFLTICGGFLFGVAVGGAAAVVAATAGASIIFLVARTAAGDVLARRAGPRLARLAEGFRTDAFSYLLFLRLVPAFPFFLVNIAPALVGVRLAPFVAATALGIIPATFVFAFVGSGLDSAIAAQANAYRVCVAAGTGDCRLDFDPRHALTPELVGALVALGALALVPVAVKRWRRSRKAKLHEVSPPH